MIVLVDSRVIIIVVELGDVGEKRVESEEEMDLPSFGVEEEKEIVGDPYQKWFNKRAFTDQDKANADTILLDPFVILTYRSIPIHWSQFLLLINFSARYQRMELKTLVQCSQVLHLLR